MAILNMNYSVSGSGGANIGEPLNLTVTSSGTDATITREDNEIGTIPPTTFAKSELVRKVGSAPTSPSDGTLVVTETVKDTYKVSGYVDSGLTDGTTYYYRVFSYSDLGGISYCDAQSVTISSAWQPGADTVAYWEFDGDLTDTMGTYNGTPSNFTCNYVALPGNPGKECLNYSTNWGHIDLASSSALADVFIQQQTDATFSIWWNPTTFTSSRDEFLIFAHSNGAIMQFAWYKNDIGWKNSLVLKTNYNNAAQPDGYTWVPTAGNRYNIIMTYDTTTKEKTYYVNGQLVGSVAAQDYKTSSSGNQAKIYESAATGYMSNMIIEKKVWSAQEVADYFSSTKADYGVS